MISIIVPVYNVEKYLHRCIDSILSQTYTDFELILVDDGSTDSCPKICDEYAEKDGRIRVLHLKNGGVAVARNHGLDVVKGEYLTFCDSDDYWDDDFLYSLLASMKEGESDCVVCDFKIVSDDGEIKKKTNHAKGSWEISSPQKLIEYIIKKVLGGNERHGWEACSRIFRMDIISDNHIRFPTTCENYSEDLGFVLNYYLYAKRVCSIDYSGYNYFFRDDSMMRKSASMIKLNQMNAVSFGFYKKITAVFNKDLIEEYYPIVHFLILYTEYSKLIGTPQYNTLAQYINNLNELDFYIEQTKQIKKCKNKLMQLYGEREARQILLFSHFCCHRNFRRFKCESAIAYKFFIK